MKKLYKDIRRTNFFLILFYFIFTPLASAVTPEARVDYINGRAFLRTANGETTELKEGDHIYHLSEINTEEGSLVGFSNFHDQQFSLAGSGYVKFFHNILELRAGYLWIEAMSTKNSKYSVQTLNAKISYEKGRAILNYDQYALKTQILTTQGRFEFSNIFESHLKITVAIGEFSFITKNYEQGMPRRPTPAGQSTFLKITSLFQNRPKQNDGIGKDTSYTLVNHEKSGFLNRAPGSHSQQARGKIIYAQTKNMKYSKKDQKLLDFNKRTVASIYEKEWKKKNFKKKFRPSYSKKSEVMLRVFGKRGPSSHKKSTFKKMLKKIIKDKEKIQSIKPEIKMEKVGATRGPASIGELNNQVDTGNSNFESSLVKEYKKQMRHSKEVNGLIRDLKAFDQDYKQSY